ncbi:MAG: transcriptional regulator [Acidobacteriota bacterium]|nr:transcriptional regulator [Acidobacteriota bacterium]
MSKTSRPVQTTSMEIHRLKGKRKGASLKEQVWFKNGAVTSYSLAYINLKLFPGDNGRVLGYDNSHGYHHRHFMGKVEPVEFISYSALVERFIAEVHQLWRVEDEEN